MVFRKKTASQQTTTAPISNDSAAAQQNVSPEERARMIAEAAYYRAERRGFQNGDQTNDWYEAEKEVEVILSRPPQKAPRK
jgi:hypothetical protein